MKFITSLAIVVALAVVGCGGSIDDSSRSETQPTQSISQLKSEAAVEHRAAEAHLRAAMRTQNPNVSHSEQIQQIKLSRSAEKRATALHEQLCELVLQDPRTPHDDQLGVIANSCD
jgi:hypothetical protein